MSYFENFIERAIKLKRDGSPIVAVIDASGAIPEQIVNQFTEMLSVVIQKHDITVHFLVADYQILNEAHYSKSDLPIKPILIGRGGTDFRPAFNWTSSTEPACLIYLTDLMGVFPEEAPGYPVLWMVVGTDQTPPFGEMTRIPLGEAK